MKAWLLPPAVLILVLAAAMAARRRWPGPAAAVLWIAIAATYGLSTSVVAQRALDSLQWYPALPMPPVVDAAEAIVVLSAGRTVNTAVGGDSVDDRTLERLRFAARLQRATGLPVLVSGGRDRGSDELSLAALMAAALTEDFGVAPRWLEEQSLTTAENARYSAALLQRQGIRRVYLVTHGWHLPRAMLSFGATGVTAIPAPATLRPVSPFAVRDLIPTARALVDTGYAVHEWLGLVWYRLTLIPQSPPSSGL